jgi:hypothetical protein
MDRDISLDLLLQETLAMSEFLRTNNVEKLEQPVQTSFLENALEADDSEYLLDLADSILCPQTEQANFVEFNAELGAVALAIYPECPGVIYKVDNGSSTFCVRGFASVNIRESMLELDEKESAKRSILKLMISDGLDQIHFFPTKNLELAEAVKEQVINRRFPHMEDALCNISDPGFSWWMNINSDDLDGEGKFEIFFRSHGINRAEKYIQLGPIGDGAIAALRMNQARTLLRSSFPISEFSCDDKSFSLASSKPDHSGFVSFKNIFLEGINNTVEENFPDNSIGRTLYYYFHELAIVRKFWIEVKTKLS